MSMIKCPECGKEISDKATNCPNCGCPSAEWNIVYKNDSKTLPQSEELSAKDLPSFNAFDAATAAFNDFDKKEKRAELEVSEMQTKQTKEKKKDSVLSIWACVLALFTVTLPVAFILALVDLGINDKERKHGGSWFAIIWGVLAIIVYLLITFLK